MPEDDIWGAGDARPRKAGAPDMAAAEQRIRRHYAFVPGPDTTPVTIEALEARYPGLRDDPRAGQVPYIVRPFGFQNPEWEALKSLIRPGDELLHYSSPAETWAHLAGRAGVVLVRDGTVVAEIVTMMN